MLVLANKIDDPRQETLALELHRLGLGDPIPISGLHGHGTGDLLDEIVDYARGARRAAPRRSCREDAIRVAILGRPNVGKSSLLNALLGRERVIVSEIPGTTRDSIDTVLERGDRTFVLVDTAGLRRKRRHRQGIEYYSELRALEAAERADVALVLIDASQGVVDQDLAVADVARKADCSTLDRALEVGRHEVRIEDVRGHLRRRLRQRPAVPRRLRADRPRARPAARHDRRALRPAHRARSRRRAEPRRSPSCARQRQPPSRNGKRLNLLYGAQIHVAAAALPHLRQRPGLVTRDYGYWVENELRERFGLDGVPVSIDFVRRS